jgi:hypothetical protein
LGDKDTFRFSFKYLKVKYHSIDYNVAPFGILDGTEFKGHTMSQFAPKQLGIKPTILFMHINLIKYKHFYDDQQVS